MPVIGEQIKTFCEAGKSHDRYAVAVTRVNDSIVVGHIPREIVKTCYYL